ncbi:MAG: carbon monoxide dehydrogenase subunit G [Acidobacteria bacterium]|nr:carbon monoxide dehydrogenase subunit G [Acidobacteriota bacterium]
MKIEGQHPFRADPAVVFSLLTDPVVLARCIPGCQALIPDGPDSYRTTLSVGVASIKGTYIARVKLDDFAPPSRFRITLDGKGPQGFVRGAGSIELTSSEGSTVVHYAGDAQLGGTLASVGQRMLLGAARMMLGQFFTALEVEAAAKTESMATGLETAPPKQGIWRNAFRSLYAILRRLLARPGAGTAAR